MATTILNSPYLLQTIYTNNQAPAYTNNPYGHHTPTAIQNVTGGTPSLPLPDIMKPYIGDSFHDFCKDRGINPVNFQKIVLPLLKILADGPIPYTDQNFDNLLNKLFENTVRPSRLEPDMNAYIEQSFLLQRQEMVVTIEEIRDYYVPGTQFSYDTTYSKDKKDFLNKVHQSNGSIKIIVPPGYTSFDEYFDKNTLAREKVAYFIKEYFFYSKFLNAPTSVTTAPVYFLFDANGSIIQSIYSYKGSGGIRCNAMACSADSANTSGFSLDPDYPTHFINEELVQYKSNVLSKDKYHMYLKLNDNCFFGPNGALCFSYGVTNRISDNLEISQLVDRRIPRAEYFFGYGDPLKGTSGASVNYLQSMFSHLLGYKNPPNPNQDFDAMITYLNTSSTKSYSQNTNHIPMGDGRLMNLFNGSENINDIIDDIMKLQTDYKRTGDYEQAYALLRFILQGYLGVFVTGDLMSALFARLLGLNAIYQVATGDQYINLYASSYHSLTEEQMVEKQQELEALQAKIKLQENVYNLFTNYYYYKILFQNLVYFSVVISRIDMIVSSCEDTTSTIISSDRGFLNGEIQKIHELFHVERDASKKITSISHKDIFNGMIGRNEDLYLSIHDGNGEPLMDENGDPIIIRNYDEYEEKGGIVLYTERFEELAGICKSAHDIYMDIIHQFPLFFERQVTNEAQWNEFYSSGRLNLSFLSIKSIVRKMLNTESVPRWVDAEIVKLIENSKNIEQATISGRPRTKQKRVDFATEVLKKACEKYVDHVGFLVLNGISIFSAVPQSETPEIDVKDKFTNYIKTLTVSAPSSGGGKKRKVKGGIGNMSKKRVKQNLFMSCNQFLKNVFSQCSIEKGLFDNSLDLKEFIQMIIQARDQTFIDSFYLSLYEIFDEVDLDELMKDVELKKYYAIYLFIYVNESLLEKVDDKILNNTMTIINIFYFTFNVLFIEFNTDEFCFNTIDPTKVITPNHMMAPNPIMICTFDNNYKTEFQSLFGGFSEHSFFYFFGTILDSIQFQQSQVAVVQGVVSVTPERSTSPSEPDSQMTDVTDPQNWTPEPSQRVDPLGRLESLGPTTPIQRNISMEDTGRVTNKRGKERKKELQKKSKSNGDKKMSTGDGEMSTDDEEEEDKMSSGGRKNITRRKNKKRIKAKKTIIKRNVKKLNKTKNKRKKINRNRTIRKRK